MSTGLGGSRAISKEGNFETEATFLSLQKCKKNL